LDVSDPDDFHWRAGVAEKPAYFFRQSGAIPYRRVDPGIEVLLITSSDGSRWIIPKGIIEPNPTASFLR
jgi:phosphohistidine phosphatase